MLSSHLIVGLGQLALCISNITLLMVAWKHFFFHLGDSLLLGNGATAVSLCVSAVSALSFYLSGNASMLLSVYSFSFMAIWCAIVDLLQVCFAYIRTSQYGLQTNFTITPFVFAILCHCLTLLTSIYVAYRYYGHLCRRNDQQNRDSIITHPFTSKKSSICCIVGGCCSLIIGIVGFTAFFGLYGSSNCYLGVSVITVGAMGMFAQRCHNLPAVDLIIIYFCRFAVLVSIIDIGFSTFYFHFIFINYAFEDLIPGNIALYLFTMVFAVFNITCATITCHSASSENRTVGLLTLTLRPPSVSTIARVGYFSGIGQFVCACGIFSCVIAVSIVWFGSTFASSAVIAGVLVLLSAQFGNHLAIDQSEDFLFIYFISSAAGAVCCMSTFGLAIYEAFELRLLDYESQVFILFIFAIIVLAVAIALQLNNFVVVGLKLKAFSKSGPIRHVHLLQNDFEENSSEPTTVVNGAGLDDNAVNA